MGFGVAPDLGDGCGDALLLQPLLDIFFGIRVHHDRHVQCLELPDSFEQVLQIGDRPIPDRPHDRACLLVERLGKQKAQLQLLAIEEVHRDAAPTIRLVAYRAANRARTFSSECRMCLQVPRVFLRKSGQEQ